MKDIESLKAFLHLIVEECKANRELAAKILASNEARLSAALGYIEKFSKEKAPQ